jgi:hypothetical protein
MKIRILFLLVLLVSAYSLPAKHRHHVTTLKDVSQDLANVSQNLASASGQVPAGTMAALYLSMAQQHVSQAQQELVDIAAKGCAENK